MVRRDAHGLFPAADDSKEPPEVVTIHVTRINDGTCARAFGPEELTSEQDIFNMFGGGAYSLIARNGHCITGRRAFTLAGRPKPLNPEPPAHEDEPEQTAPPTPPTLDPMLAYMMQMMQLQAQQARDAAHNQTQLLVGMMQAQQAAADQHVRAAAVQQERFATLQMEMMKQLMAPKEVPSADVGGTLDTFLRGVDFAREVEPSGELDELMESVAPLVAGMVQGQEHQGKKEE